MEHTCEASDGVAGEVRVKICESCKNEFDPGNNPKKRHCGRKCWLTRYNKTDPDGHGARGAKAAGEANIIRLRGTGTKWYVKENQRHQHLVIAEQMLGRALLPGEVVHHEDRNKKNNDPSNLIVFVSQAEHARHHGLGHHEGRNLPCLCIRSSAEMLTG